MISRLFGTFLVYICVYLLQFNCNYVFLSHELCNFLKYSQRARLLFNVPCTISYAHGRAPKTVLRARNLTKNVHEKKKKKRVRKIII